MPVSRAAWLRPLWLLGAFLAAFNSVAAPPDLDGIEDGIWIDRERIKALPMEGPAWEKLLKDADRPIDHPDLTNQDERTKVYVVAKALVYVRTGKDEYRDQVIEVVHAVMGTETRPGGRTLALGRNLMGYVLAADLVGLPDDLDEEFRAWLQQVVNYRFASGRTLISTHEGRPNNWGTAAGASRIAVSAYLGDEKDLERAAQVYLGWCGDRSSYDGFKYKKVEWWQADPTRPVGINPSGSEIAGHSVDGVLPEEMRRAGPFHWPPKKENYAYTGLQGALPQAVMLDRLGYDAFGCGDQALRRAFEWLYKEADYPAEDDDEWMIYVINDAYDIDLPVTFPASRGKVIGYADWTHPTAGD